MKFLDIVNIVRNASMCTNKTLVISELALLGLQQQFLFKSLLWVPPIAVKIAGWSGDVSSEKK